MKISLALGPRRPLSRQTAWGCLTANLAIPGVGSLMGGRIAGYPQAALGFGGLAMSLVFGLRFVYWSLVHWQELHGGEADPLEILSSLWFAGRWPLLGMATFGAGWLWALATSLNLLRGAQSDSPAPQPPRLTKDSA